MAELRERVLAEEQNIARALEQMPQANRLCELNELELAGTAAFLKGLNTDRDRRLLAG